jgi:flavin reductase (DIM6/NTAB) family NADH-FMN oxidoreductase RutF
MFPTGVAIITTRTAAGSKVGLTCNSFSSVSLTPPLVLWSLSKRSSKLPDFLQAGHFGVSVLAVDQKALSHRFASPRENRFHGVDLRFGATGIPLIEGAAAHFECARECSYDGGDHVIFLGRVAAFSYDEKEPLVFHRSRYGALSGAKDLAAELRQPGLAEPRSEPC